MTLEEFLFLDKSKLDEMEKVNTLESIEKKLMELERKYTYYVTLGYSKQAYETMQEIKALMNLKNSL